MQQDDVNKKGLAKDSIVRSYQVEEHEYRIQPQDVISVIFESLTPEEFDFLNNNQSSQGGNNNIAGNEQLIGDLVDNNGEIPFPFIGKVKVAGLTVFEIRDNLQKLADDYLDSPVVKVRLLNFRFTVLGAVNKEGTVVLDDNRVTMLEAIGRAGGLADLADRANVKLIRQTNEAVTIQYIDLLKEDFINSPYYYIHQNDVLVVSVLKQRPYQTYFGRNLALLISSLSLLLLVINLSQ